MAMRLVQIEGDRRLSAQRLPDGELLIGRDDDADLVVPSQRASRRHAIVAPYQDAHSLQDLGSANGTRVNGHPIAEAVLLTPGDVIEIGGVLYRYEEGGAGPPTALLAAGGAALLLVLLAAGLFWLWPGGGGGELGEAVVLAREAIRAHDDGDGRGAKRSLNGAVALVVARGYVDEVPPQRARQAALQLIQQQLGADVDLMRIYQDSLAESRARRPPPAAARPRRGPCRTDGVSRRDLSLCIRERAEGILVDLWQDPRDIPESFYDAVEEQFLLVLARRRSWVTGALERGQPLWPMMERELEAAKMPRTLRYLSMIESGYQPRITSKAGARGLWQFMPRTARQYGLRVDGDVDERTDPEKSTRAAARYLRDLAFEFGGDALLLAIASYNKGENGIRRALKKLDDPRTDRSYWTLVQRGLIPSETQDYVPRLVAAAVMGEAGVPAVDVVPPS